MHPVSHLVECVLNMLMGASRVLCLRSLTRHATLHLRHVLITCWLWPEWTVSPARHVHSAEGNICMAWDMY
jgi:hypothetical protein